jgi:hypothetical protein
MGRAALVPHGSEVEEREIRSDGRIVRRVAATTNKSD